MTPYRKSYNKQNKPWYRLLKAQLGVRNVPLPSLMALKESLRTQHRILTTSTNKRHTYLLTLNLKKCGWYNDMTFEEIHLR